MTNTFWSTSSTYRVKPLSLPENGHFSPPSLAQLELKTDWSPPSLIPALERKTDWRSIYLCAVFTFTASVQFSLFFTSLWPFMQILDSSVTVSYFGAVIAMYSLSQIVASPLLGIWSNRIEKLKPPLILCNIFMFIGNMLYWLVELFPTASSRYILCISRLIAGTGWAQVSLLKSYAAAASLNEDRSRATAIVTGGVALGTVMGPAFQMLFTWIDYPGLPICFGQICLLNISNKSQNIFEEIYSFFPPSMFTTPAIFASAMNIILMFILIFRFHENYTSVLERKKDKVETNVGPRLPPYDKLAVAICFAMRFTQFFIFTNLETIGTAFAMMMFLWSPTEVVLWESIAHSTRGVLALAVYIAYIFLDLGKRVNDRLACFCSLFGLFLFHVFTFSWPFLSENVLVYEDHSTKEIIPGCNRTRFVWCDDLKQINVWLYYAAMLICIGFAFPNINVTMNTLFSRIIGPRMQSKQQGMLEMFGGMGRMLGPLLIGFLYRNYGPRAIWILEMIEVGVMGLLWLIFYRRLVPLKIPPEMEEQRRNEEHQRARGSFGDGLPN